MFVELPQVGDTLTKGDEFGTVESVKAVSELFCRSAVKSPLSTELEEAPELVNTSPYEEGWMIDVKPDDPAQLEALMTNDAYLEMLKGL